MLPPLRPISEIDEKELFAASYAKLARAQNFIKELEAELKRYHDSDPLSARFDYSTKTPRVHVSWKAITLLPGTIVGDAVHNLRTALDLMASELARVNGHSDEDVYFPFATSQDRFDHAIKSRRFDRAGGDAVELLRTFSPYRGGNERLRALHDLDILDKHTALVPTGHTMNVKLEGSYRIDDVTKHEVSVRADDINYTFPPNTPLADERIVEALKDLMQLVHGIVEAFAGLVRSRAPSI